MEKGPLNETGDTVALSEKRADNVGWARDNFDKLFIAIKQYLMKEGNGNIKVTICHESYL